MSTARYTSGQFVRERTHLYGRDAEFNRLTEWLSSGGLYAIYGGERIGKTSLLHVLHAHLAGNLTSDPPQPPLVLSLLPQAQAYAADQLISFYQALIKDLRTEVGQRLGVCTVDDVLEEVSEAHQSNPYRFFERAFQVLYQASQEIVRTRLMGQRVRAFADEIQADLRVAILLDDAHYLLDTSWGHDLLKHLQAFYSARSPLRDKLVILMAGSGELQKILESSGSPVAGILSQPVLLKCLDRGAVAQVINKPLADKSLSDEVVDTIRDLTGGHPYLVKYLMQQIDAALPGDLTELLALTAREIEESSDALDISESRTLFRLWNRGLTDIERMLYHHLLAARPTDGTDWPGLAQKSLQGTLSVSLGETVDLSSSLDALIYYGLVESRGRLAKTYRPHGRLFIRWFEEHVPYPRSVITDEPQYLSFQLRILEREGEDGPYPIEVESSAGFLARREECVFDPPLPFIEEIETLLTHMRSQTGAIDRNFVRDLGQRLYRTLFQGKVKSLYAQCLGLAQDGPGVVLHLWTDSPELLGWPWEILYDEDTGEFLALSERRPVVRFLPLLGGAPTLETELPLRILLVSAAPNDLPPFGIEREITLIQDELAGYQDQVQMTVLRHCTRDLLVKALQQGSYHVFHFIGHGALQEDGKGIICLEDDYGDHVPLNGDELGGDLRSADVRLAVLNACETGAMGVGNPIQGIAPALLTKGVAAVVAMQLRVSDESMATFSRNFYVALAGHPLVDRAAVTGRRMLPGAEQGNAIDWVAPALFLRSKGSRILRYGLTGGFSFK